MSRVWFITGASRGIGLEIARQALSAGERVVATGRTVDSVQAALGNPSEHLLCLALDVTQPGQAERAVQDAVAAFGRIDVLVNNAGYGHLGVFEEIGAREIAAQFDTNVFGLMHVTRQVLPVMRRQKSGRIFNLSSVGGVVGFPGAAVYCATKFAVEGFGASLAPEIAPLGIQLTTVEPGFTRTDFLKENSVRYGSQNIADYAGVDARGTFEAYNGQQAGDPKKLAAAVLEISRRERQPLNLPTGSDAAGMIEATLAGHLEQVRALAPLARSVDFAA